MRYVLRRTPLAFPKGPSAAQAQGLPARLLLQLLSLADQPRGKKRAGVAARKSHRQRNQLFSQSSAARSFAENRSRRNFEAQTGTARLDSARMERRMLIRARSLLGRYPYLRCACLLLFAQPAALRYAFPQAADSAAMEAGDRSVGHQLRESALRPGRAVHGNPDGAGRLHMSAALLREIRRQVRRQATAQTACAIRLSQIEDRILATPQRHDSVPQRDDLFR